MVLMDIWSLSCSNNVSNENSRSVESTSTILLPSIGYLKPGGWIVGTFPSENCWARSNVVIKHPFTILILIFFNTVTILLGLKKNVHL